MRIRNRSQPRLAASDLTAAAVAPPPAQAVCQAVEEAKPPLPPPERTLQTDGEAKKMDPLRKQEEATENRSKRTEEEEEWEKRKGKKGKKRRGAQEGLLMEGSRCSRVNGRGWRCSQQTLVGYSLCEHHLGKGRIWCNKPPRHEAEEDEEEEGKKEKKKRKEKMGSVKARSISSLLHQPDLSMPSH